VRPTAAGILPPMQFAKWQALGNDYIVIEARDLPFELSPARIQAICEPHLGIGSDGILLLSEPADPAHVADLRIFNPDGSEAELSGNGVREAVLYLRSAGWTDRDRFTIRTAAGEVSPELTGPGSARVAMGRAATESRDYPGGDPSGVGRIDVGGAEREFQHVSIGNPQCAIEIDSGLEDLDLQAIGPEIEAAPAFPNRTNVSFWQADGSRVRARIFERGVGETLSSGTGATGAAVAAHLRGAASPIVVDLDGGELEVEISANLDIHLTGTAEPVFAGALSADFLARLSSI
jgi:diaminopimelate epimerase